MKGDRERFLAGGMDGYVAKPIRDEDLEAVITEAVSGWASVRHEWDRTADPAATPLGSDPVGGSLLEDAAVLARVGGDRDALRELVAVLQEACRELTAELAEAVSTRDADRVRVAAHTVKGMTAFFAADRATAVATRLERMGMNWQLVGAEEVTATLAREITAASAALNRYVSEPAPTCPRIITVG